MHIKISPDNLLERVALAAGVVPLPLLDALHTVVLARSVMVAMKLDLFERLAGGPRPAAELAQETGTVERSLEKLLAALVGAGYLRFRGGRYSLSPLARRWLLKASPGSLRDSLLFGFMQWDLVARLEDFVRTGKDLPFYEELDPERWGIYQRSMQANASMLAPEMVRRLQGLKGARTLLDLGGGHGYHAAALCRRWPQLQATVMDLPEALAAVDRSVAQGLEGRLTYQAGDALKEDLGEARYDVVLLAQLVHHFDDETNRALVRRVARALRPGGRMVLQEWIRPSAPDQANQSELLGDLFFSLVSKRGTWSFEEMDAWSTAAGLVPHKRIRLLSVPGMGLYVARAR